MSPRAGGAIPDISSARNPAIVASAKLHRTRERRRRGQTLLEGPNMLAAAVGAGHRPQMVFAPADDDESRRVCREVGLELRTVSDRALRRLAATESPRGPIAVLEIPRPEPLRAADTLVLLGVADPGNAGTLIRSAGAFGFGVAAGSGTVDVWAPKTLRAGAGVHFHVAHSVVGDDAVSELKAAGLTVAAAVPAGGEPVERLPYPAALLIGSEPGGLPDRVVTAADILVSIPMRSGVESLNAAVAGSILMYERARARGRGA